MLAHFVRLMIKKIKMSKSWCSWWSWCYHRDLYHTRWPRRCEARCCSSQLRHQSPATSYGNCAKSRWRRLPHSPKYNCRQTSSVTAVTPLSVIRVSVVVHQDAVRQDMVAGSHLPTSIFKYDCLLRLAVRLADTCRSWHIHRTRWRQLPVVAVTSTARRRRSVMTSTVTYCRCWTRTDCVNSCRLLWGVQQPAGAVSSTSWSPAELHADCNRWPFNRRMMYLITTWWSGCFQSNVAPTSASNTSFLQPETHWRFGVPKRHQAVWTFPKTGYHNRRFCKPARHGYNWLSEQAPPTTDTPKDSTHMPSQSMAIWSCRWG